MIAPIVWLLDTNVASEMIRPIPEPRVADFLDSIAVEGIGIAVISIWEILNGIGQLNPGRRREELTTRFHDILDDVFEDRVLEWSAFDALACAEIMEEKRRLGEPLDRHLPDGMLAGTARSRNLTVVTRNEREFRNTGVEVINPWTAEARGNAKPD